MLAPQCISLTALLHHIKWLSCFCLPAHYLLSLLFRQSTPTIPLPVITALIANKSSLYSVADLAALQSFLTLHLIKNRDLWTSSQRNDYHSLSQWSSHSVGHSSRRCWTELTVSGLEKAKGITVTLKSQIYALGTGKLEETGMVRYAHTLLTLSTFCIWGWESLLHKTPSLL